MAGKPGKSGGKRNGAGRPLGIEERVKRLTQRRLGAAQMLDTLKEVESWKWVIKTAKKSKDARSVALALQYWRDRLEGKPAQSLQHMGEGGGVIKVELITEEGRTDAKELSVANK